MFSMDAKRSRIGGGSPNRMLCIHSKNVRHSLKGTYGERPSSSILVSRSAATQHGVQKQVEITGLVVYDFWDCLVLNTGIAWFMLESVLSVFK